MKNKDLICKSVQGEVTEKSVMIEFKVDVNNTPSFLHSPFVEDWIWSENIIDLNRFIYEVIIPEYLINVLIIEDDKRIENRYYLFDEAINLYRTSELNNSFISEMLDKLNTMYTKYHDDDTLYIDFLKMIISVEEILYNLDINLKCICYVNPYEARFSNNLKKERFDYNNLGNNF